MQLHALLFLAPGRAADERLTKAAARRGEGNINVVVQRLSRDIAGLGTFFFGACFAHQSDHLIIMRAHFYLLIERVLVRKKAPGQSRGDGANVVLVKIIRVANKTSAQRIQAGNFFVNGIRAHDLSGHFIAKKADVLADVAFRQHVTNARDGRLNPARILVG